MSGTISLSLSQQFDALGNPLAGGLLHFYQAGTVATPQNAYQDAALTVLHPNPIVLNAAGRVPQFYLADGSIKVVLTDSLSASQLTADNILVVGPSGGGGGAGVDPTTVLSTGDIKLAYGTAVLAGFVRCNGRTIGSATSGATERANSDCQSLFTFLWNADSLLAVSAGRGATAIADWSANKTIALPDGRGKAFAALSDMGNVDAGTFSGATFDRGSGTQLGSILGRARRTLLTTNLPAYTPAGTYSASLASGTLNSGTLNSGLLVGGSANVNSSSILLKDGIGAQTIQLGGGGGSGFGWSNLPTVGTLNSIGSVTGTVTGTVSGTVTGTVSGSITGTAQGGTSTPFDAVSPYILVTVYLKL